MEEIILYLLTFLIVYLVYLFLIILRKKKLKKFRDSTEVRYLFTKYKLEEKNINMNVFPHVIALANAFIMSTTVTIAMLVPNFILKFIVGFVVLIPLILITYHILGTYYRRKMK